MEKNDSEDTAESSRRLLKMVMDWQERQASLADRIARRDLRWRNIRGVLIAASIIVAPMLSLGALQLAGTPTRLGKGYAALVRIDGTIEPGSRSSAQRINESLERAFSDRVAKGVVIDINSPGGTPVQASLINQRIRELRAQHPEKKLVVIGEDMLTSGAYLVAVASDNICVNDSTMTGSIGVRMDGWGLQNVLTRLNLERRSFTAGEHKERLDMYRPLTEDDKVKVTGLLRVLHGQFIDAVAKGRGQRLKGDPELLYSGDFWTGAEAVKLGLVDGLCTLQGVLHGVFAVENARDYSPPESVLSVLTGNAVRSASDAVSSRITGFDASRPMLMPFDVLR
jgi:protease-4